MLAVALAVTALAGDCTGLGDCDYDYCLAYQQATYDPADRVAEACTWAIANHRRWHRFSLAVTGHLEQWLWGDLAKDRAAAEQLHPEFAGLYPTYDEHLPDPEPVFDSAWMEGRDKPIRLDAARAMLDQVLLEESRAGRPPKPGEPIRWSPEFHRHHPNPQFSRILVTLTFGASSRLLRTGREQELVDWIEAQPAHSVTIEGLFRSSYRACDGDVYLTLLTAENVLSRYFLDPDRARLAYLTRLRPITNTWADRGDAFGAWYHLFGMMLYSYARGGFAGWVTGSAEATGSRISNPPGEVERQEGYVNLAGARLGAWLRRRVRTGEWEERPDDPRVLAESAYMDLVEFPHPAEGL